MREDRINDSEVLRFPHEHVGDLWKGDIIAFNDYGSHYELKIESRSSIHVLLGKTDFGGFACMPDFRTGCHLADPSDLFWNTEQLIRIMGKVDGITVAYAIKVLADKIHF